MMENSSRKKEVLNAVEKICAHKIFNRSPMMCAFLRYVVIETLEGRADRIIAYSVAVDALGKSINFDTQLDPSVRVLAKRLRDSLSQYYEEESDFEIRVAMQPGSYVPSFVYHKCYIRDDKPFSGNSSTSPSGSVPPTWTKPVVSFEE